MEQALRFATPPFRNAQLQLLGVDQQTQFSMPPFLFSPHKLGPDSQWGGWGLTHSVWGRLGPDSQWEAPPTSRLGAELGGVLIQAK